MKITYAVACLLGLAAAGQNEPVWKLTSVLGHRDDHEVQLAYGEYSAKAANERPPYQSTLQLGGKDEPVWKLSSVLGHRDDHEVQLGYGDYSTKAANGRPPYQSTVQILADKVIEKNPTYNAWESIKDGAADGKYERVITPNFSSDSDDIFMRSMITKYAHEKRTPIEELDDGSKIGGEPTGVFMMGKKDMQYAAKEVLGTHKGLSGAALAQYMDTYFDKAWSNFDVNGDGAIEVIKSPMFMRFLCSDQGMQLGESG